MSELTCRKCSKPKTDDDFYHYKKPGSRAGKRIPPCKECQQNAASERLKLRRERGVCTRCSENAAPGYTCCLVHVRAESSRTKAAARRLKEKAVEYKGKKCADCGLETDVLAVYDFHHEDPKKKDFSFRDVGTQMELSPELKVELDKCVLLCSNCHKTRHWFGLQGVNRAPN